MSADWSRLWQLAARVGEAAGKEPDYVFLPIGLCLEDPATARPWDYDTTPVNARTFGSTGGDGVHFSAVDGLGPVVMTVPMAFDRPNHIVGADLRDFLALGYWTGYSCLERLAYRSVRAETIMWLQAGPYPADPEEVRLLRQLAAEFDLQPWRNVERRLDELDAAYVSRLQLR